MRKIVILIFCYSFFLASCSQAKKDVDAPESQIASRTSKSFSAEEAVQKKFQSQIADWNEYLALDDFLASNFKNVTSEQILLTSEQLSKLSKSLRDSIIPEKINDNSLQARLNLMYSETLRLYDISTISAIQESEVLDQAHKVFNAFSSINAKINSMLEQQELERKYGDNIDYFSKLSKDSAEKAVKKKPKKVNPNIPSSVLPKKTSKKKKKKFSTKDIKASKND